MSLCLPILQAALARSYDSLVRTAPSFANLRAWWKGNAAVDSQGLFSSGNIFGSGTVFTSEPMPDGAELGATSFNGSGHISYNHPAALTSLDQGTFLVVLRPTGTSLSTGRSVFARLQQTAVPPLGGSRLDTRLMWENNGLQWVVNNNTSLPENKAIASYGLSEWAVQCVAASWGPAGMRLMLDGDLVATNPYSGAAPVMSSNNWLHAAAGFAGGTSSFYVGLMSHLQLYAVQLSDAQMRALMPEPHPRVTRPEVFNNAGATSYANNFTVTGRTNRKLVVVLGRDSATTLSNVRWKGSAGTVMTLIEEVVVGNLLLRVYELVNPSSGSGTVYFDASAVNDVFCMALEVGHVQQALTAGADTRTHGSGSATSSSASFLGVAADDLVLSFLLHATGSVTATKTGSGSTIMGLANNYGPGGFWKATVTQYSPFSARDVDMSYNLSAIDALCHIAIRYRSSGTGTGGGGEPPVSFVEDWNYTGTWAAAKWGGLGISGTSLVDATGTEGRMLAQGANTFDHARISCLATAMGDFELTSSFRMGSTGEQYHALNFRVSGGWSSSVPIRPFDGYHLSFYNDGLNQRVQVQPSVGGTLSGTAVFATKTWGTGTWNLRLRAEGSSIRVRVWQGTEPGTWDLDASFTTHASGTFQWAAGNGSTTTARSIFWDNLLIAPI